MDNAAQLVLALLVAFVLLKAFRNVLAKEATGDHYPGRSLTFAAMGVAELIGVFGYVDPRPPVWVVALVMLSVGGLFCLAVDFWRGKWEFGQRGG